MANQPLILTVIIKEHAKKYTLSKDKAERLLEIISSYYPRDGTEQDVDKDELISLIKSSNILSVTQSGNQIEVRLEPYKNNS